MTDEDRERLAIEAESDRQRAAAWEEFHRQKARILCDGLWTHLAGCVALAITIGLVVVAEPFSLAAALLVFFLAADFAAWCRSLTCAILAVREYRELYGPHPGVGLWRERGESRMPPELDPAWEYWTGDPEIEELLAEAAGGNLHGFARVDDARFVFRGWNEGIRYGHGNPDAGVFKSRKSRPKTRETLDNRICPGCGVSFQPSHRHRKFCSNSCVNTRGAEKRWPRMAVCLACNGPFAPMHSKTTYCSIPCANVAKRAVERLIEWRGKPDLEPNEKPCKWCDGPIRGGRPSKAKIYCSAKCRAAAIRKRYHANNRDRLNAKKRVQK